jgi:general stress protein YciG
MAGTTEGAEKAAQTRKQHDPDAFKKMGEKGGHASHGGAGNQNEKQDEEE